MLICASLRTAISTGTKNRAFGLLQNKPKQTQPVVNLSNLFQSQKILLRLTMNPLRISLCYIWEPVRLKSPDSHKPYSLMKRLSILLVTPSGNSLHSKYEKALISMSKKGLFDNSMVKNNRKSYGFYRPMSI